LIHILDMPIVRLTRQGG